MLPSVEGLIEGAKAIVQQIGDEFTKPDDDWQGVFVLVSRSEATLIPAVYANDEQKEVFCNIIIPEAVRIKKALMVAQVHSAWTVEVSPTKAQREKLKDAVSYRDAGLIPPSKHPARVECVILVCVTTEDVQLWSAKINRFKDKPPRLGEWRLWSEGDVTGQMIDPIQKALQEVNA